MLKLEETPIWDTVRELYKGHPDFPRAYHNFQHAQDVLDRVDQVQNDIGFINYEAVRIAALFHDVVYIPGNPDNELESARVMMDMLISRDDIMPSETSTAYSLIVFTNNHMSPRRFYAEWDTMLFLDCDMLGFGLDWDIYQKNNDDIDLEFRSAKNFNEEKYTAGRIKFLKALYEKGVFRSPYFQKKYEEKALANLRQYLKQEFGVTV